MTITEEMKKRYIEDVHEEMKKRGFTANEIPTVIDKTGFMDVMQNYPEEQLHYDVRDAVNEIMLTASLN